MKVFIADDSVLVREQLKTMLSQLPKIEVIGEAGDALESIRHIWRLKPDVVVLDIRMRRGTGIDVLLNIKKNESDPLVIMLTNFADAQYRKNVWIWEEI